MTKVKLYWAFYKSTIIINPGFSFTISMVLFPVFFTVLPITFMSFGPIISLLHKEVLRKNEYYFYYNKGISKLGLVAASFGFSVLIGIVLLFILPDVKSFGD